MNSRNSADDEAVRTVASLAGFAPRVTHRVDSLDLVEDLVVAGLGVGLLPADRPTIAGVRVLPLSEPTVMLRAYATVRRGRAEWPPLALVLDLLAEGERDLRGQARGCASLYAARSRSLVTWV